MGESGVGVESGLTGGVDGDGCSLSGFVIVEDDSCFVIVEYAAGLLYTVHLYEDVLLFQTVIPRRNSYLIDKYVKLNTSPPI